MRKVQQKAEKEIVIMTNTHKNYNRSNPFPPPLHAGFSFVEMIVAIGILMFSVTFIISIFSSNNAEREKVLNYYVALSVANKIIEDIDNTIRENPYFLSEISKYDKNYKVFAANSPFFMSIEDFNLDGKLNDDIKNYTAGFDIKKIENFEYRIKISEIGGFEGLKNHIARVTITVEWPEAKKQKEYSFSTIFSGVPIVTPASELEFKSSITPAALDKLKTALNSSTTDFKAHSDALGDDYESLYNLGLISVFTDALKDGIKKIDIDIQNIKSGPQQDLYAQIALAGLYEKKSIILMQNFNYIKFPASALLAQLKNDKFKIDGFAAANPACLQTIKNNIGLLRKTDPVTNCSAVPSYINAFSDSIHSAFLIYLNLLSEPAIETKLNLRERQSIFLKIIDLGSALILNKNENITVNIGSYPLTVKQTVKNTLRNLQLYYDLRNIARSAYIGLLFAKINLGIKLPAEEELEKKYDDTATLAKFCERLYTML